MFAGQEDFLSNIVHFSNVSSMLGQRRNTSIKLFKMTAFGVSREIVNDKDERVLNILSVDMR